MARAYCLAHALGGSEADFLRYGSPKPPPPAFSNIPGESAPGLLPQLLRRKDAIKRGKV